MPYYATSGNQSCELDPLGDNQPALQTFIDSLPVNSSVRFPAGTWKLGAILQLHKTLEFVGDHQQTTIFKSIGSSWRPPVIGWGVDSIGQDNGQWIHGVRLRNLCVWQNVVGGYTNTCITGYGDNFIANGIRVKGCKYEGLVIGGANKNAQIFDSIGEDCGNGGPAYTQSTSAFNSHARNTLYRRCEAFGCGQGFEFGNTGTRLYDCYAHSPGIGAPAIGFNCGSNVFGIYDVLMMQCKTSGYAAAVATANGIGRLSRVKICCLTVYDGSISFAGGQTVNNVPQEWQGPDIYGSEISHCSVILTAPMSDPIIYNTGPNVGGSVMGREPILIYKNTIHYELPNQSLQTTPSICFAGHITAKCKVDSNTIDGLDAAPARGDIASFTNNSNPAVAGMPNLSISRNIANKVNKTTRSVISIREGS